MTRNFIAIFSNHYLVKNLWRPEIRGNRSCSSFGTGGKEFQHFYTSKGWRYYSFVSNSWNSISTSGNHVWEKGQILKIFSLYHKITKSMSRFCFMTLHKRSIESISLCFNIISSINKQLEKETFINHIVILILVIIAILVLLQEFQ